MTILVHVALIGWIPLVLVLFSALPPRRAVIAAFLIAWLFLPMAGYQLAGLPDYNKMSATCLGVLLGALLFDSERVFSFRPNWVDVPMAVYIGGAFITSILNGLGAHDGLSSLVGRIVLWGLPYMIGRLYFQTWTDLRELAFGILIGGLVYLPLVLFEVRMSPQLHNWVYGFSPVRWNQVQRGTGYRPVVFMQHSLMVAMWMGVAALLAFWFWRRRLLDRVFQVPMSFVALALLATVPLCGGLGALMLTCGGIAVLLCGVRWKTAKPLWLLVLLPPLYLATRTVGDWDAVPLVTAARYVSDERAESLQCRIDNENILSARAMERPVFGWGGWGRNRPSIEDVEHTITDSLWIITFGTSGFVGLIAIVSVFLVPAVLFLRRVPAQLWTHPQIAPTAALAVVVTLYQWDNLFNAMVNPIFTLVAGGLCTTLVLQPRLTRAAAAGPAGVGRPAAPQRVVPVAYPHEWLR